MDIERGDLDGDSGLCNKGKGFSVNGDGHCTNRLCRCNIARVFWIVLMLTILGSVRMLFYYALTPGDAMTTLSYLLLTPEGSVLTLPYLLLTPGGSMLTLSCLLLTPDRSVLTLSESVQTLF